MEGLVELDEERFLEELEALEPEGFFFEELEEEPEEELFFFVDDNEEEDPEWLLRKSSFFWASVNSARSGASMTPAEKRRDKAPMGEIRIGFSGTDIRLPAEERGSSRSLRSVERFHEIETFGGSHGGRGPRLSRGEAPLEDGGLLFSLRDTDHPSDQHPDHPVEKSIPLEGE